MIFSLERINVTFADRPVLRDISFQVAPGERLVILGINGCGKTTLLKLLDGLIFASSGTLTFAEQTLSPSALEKREFRRRFRQQVVLLFQNVDALLFNPTVADEIAFGPRQLGLSDQEVQSRLRHWAAQFQLTEMLDRPPFELSGGEKKRVALAALLALEPSVLLLDEATANLDPAMSAFLVDFLNQQTQTTVITATHNLTVASELGSRALLLSPNQSGLLYDGPIEALLANADLLIQSGLAHQHGHHHHGVSHRHFHLHDAE